MLSNIKINVFLLFFHCRNNKINYICKQKQKPKKLKTMKTKKFFICDLDTMGQRTGEYKAVEIPTLLVINRGGCFYLAVDYIHESGHTETGGTCFLYSSELQALRAALS